jgi:Kdo2-lipid IVA lauroyltransferase/acyltransferase
MSLKLPDSRSRRFYFYIQFLFLRTSAAILKFLDEKIVYRLSDAIGFFLFLRKRRREYCISNLRNAFPEKSENEIKSIGLQSMQNIVRIIFEFMRIPLLAKNPEDFIEMRGTEHVWDALKQNKGVIWVVGHFGNWELAGIASAAHGFPMHAIGKTYKNPLINQFIRKLRGMTGLQTIDQTGAVRKTIQLLKENQVVAMLVDEHAKGQGAVWVDFFGRKAATSALPAMLALKYRTPVIALFYYRETDKRSVMVFDSPFPLIETGDYDADILANTQQYMKRLEDELRKRPADWTLWMHNRWREEKAK